MKKLLFVLAFLACASTVHAQSITKWTLRVYNVGAAAPLTPPADLLPANVICGLDPAAIVPSPNPLKAAWNDVANVGKVCLWADPGTGPLLSTPFGGSFEATLTASNTAGTSAESARVPFLHPGVVPNVPTGLLLGK